VFSPGRYIVVDDQVDELRILVEALHDIGAPCLGVRYTGKPLDPAAFAGVRVLFSDLNLLSGGNPKQQFGAIEAMLRQNIDPSVSGPYILVLWTSLQPQIDGLRAYLQERLDPQKRPLAVLGLDKSLYIVNGKLEKPKDLADAITDRISASPQIRALIAWEGEVLAAAGATLAEVTELVPVQERDVAGFSEKLDGVLSCLAVAAAGAPNVETDRRAAINAALAPVLADRIANTRKGAGRAEVWDQAITRHKDLPELDDEQIGRMNRVLHVAMPNAENLRAKDWGAVLQLPAEALTDDETLRQFGLPYAELMSQVFCIDRRDRARTPLVAVRIGAICDHAQQKSGPVPYVLGVLVPTTVERKKMVQKAEFETPVLVLDPAQGPVRLYINARFQLSMVTPPETWQLVCRLREQLLMMIAAHVGEYVTRPGVIKLPI
jgi:hypothetical protein